MTADGTITGRYGDIKRDHAVSEEVYQNPESIANTVVSSQSAKIYLKNE